MTRDRLLHHVLVAEDDDDDFFLVREAFEEADVSTGGIARVADGKELLDYLRRQGRWSPPAEAPRPDLVLLDLRMPRMGGREALREIRADPELRPLPVIALTTSRSPDDVVGAYREGVNSFVRKPSSFTGLVDAVRALERYWFQVVELPGTVAPEARS